MRKNVVTNGKKEKGRLLMRHAKRKSVANKGSIKEATR